MRRNVSVTFRGKEVENPVARKIIVALLIALVPILMAVGIVAMVVLIPVMIILHPFFTLFNRVGTIRYDGRVGIALKLDRDSFRRR